MTVRQRYRVYMNITLPTAVDTHASSGESAWQTAQLPQNRVEIAKRLLAMSPEEFVLLMELRGFVEEIPEESAIAPESGALISAAAIGDRNVVGIYNESLKMRIGEALEKEGVYPTVGMVEAVAKAVWQ